MQKIDFDEQAKKLLETKEQWWGMSFKEQSYYKCDKVGMGSARFNDVIWE